MSKILCLHGYCQNGTIFKQRIAVLCKELLRKQVECVFVDGQLKPTKPFIENNPEDGRAWWNSNADNSVYVGLEDTIEYLKGIEKTLGPFDGIFGFSQGATLAAILASQLQESPKFIVVCGGFVPRAKHALDMVTYKGKALHIIGLNDQLISVDLSKKLAAKLAGTTVDKLENVEQFGNQSFYIHDGGHFVPGKVDQRSKIGNWIVEALCEES